MNKTAILIGATGLVGKALLEQLVVADSIQKITTLTRRAMPHSSPKVANHVVNFDKLDESASLIKGDVLFCCLGTTLKQAGSIAAQRLVDVDYQFKVAELAAANEVRHCVLVSASGANEKSNNAYLHMKGELEQKISALAFERISILQPSLLLGERPDFRLGESLASYLLPVLCLLPGLKSYRPIKAEQVAKRMLQACLQPGPPLEVFKLDQIFVDV